MTEPALREDASAAEARLRSAQPRFSWPVDWLCRRLLASIRIAPGAVEHVRALAQRGAVVYVMRQRSLGGLPVGDLCVAAGGAAGS